MKHLHRSFLLVTCITFAMAVVSNLTGTTSATIHPRSPLAHCFCKISKDNLHGKTNATGVLRNLTGEVNQTYVLQGLKQQEKCQDSCQSTASQYVKDQSIAADACAAGASDQTKIMAWSAVGTAWYRGAEHIGTLKHVPKVTNTICTCPSGWTCNGCSPQVDGGVTSDGQCKRLACQGNMISPYPPNGTQIGSWGFSWGNALYAWGTPANGGAPNCVTTVLQPLVCGWY